MRAPFALPGLVRQGTELVKQLPRHQPRAACCLTAANAAAEIALNRQQALNGELSGPVLGPRRGIQVDHRDRTSRSCVLLTQKAGDAR